MSNEQIIIGPPGCGKTTWIASECARAIERHGPEGAMVVSLTRAAAREAAGKTGLADKMVGTLHSVCYKALDRPSVVGVRAVREWNENYPDWQLSGPEVEEVADQSTPSATLGDRLMSRLEVCRHKLTSFQDGGMLQDFASAWSDFKQQTSIIDFTDMIEMAHEALPRLPVGTRFLLVDEFQDLSRLELRLIRKWADAGLEQFALVGDPNQSIYHWRHAARESSQVTPTLVLNQSHRVPRSVQKVAEDFIRQSTTHLQADYYPRDEQGCFTRSGCTTNDAEAIIAMANKLDGSVLVLTSCSYMLEPLIALLRRRGIPYHNPYHPRGMWNPLARGDADRHTAADRLMAWLACSGVVSGEPLGVPLPTVGQIVLLAKCMLRSGARKLTEKELDWMADETDPAKLRTLLSNVFTLAAYEAMAQRNLQWLLENTQAATRRSLEYPAAVFRAGGATALTETPKLAIGTIHSAKGGQADHVILSPDVSRGGYSSFRQPGWANHDGVIRTFYVGLTRAKQSLTVLQHSTWKVDI